MHARSSVLAAAFAVASTGAAAAECGKVSITDMDWASGRVVTAVATFLMEQGYGCQVTRVPSSTIPAIASVAQTGEPDILTEIWVNYAPAYTKMKDEGKIIELGKVLSEGGVEGWYVPTYLVEMHPELKTLDGILANPELVGGRFHNQPDGMGSRIVNDNLAKAADFSGHGIENFAHGSVETVSASIAAAYEDKAPWFGYYYGPTSILGKYPMQMIEIAPYDSTIHSCNATPNCATPALSAYPAAEVVTAATNALVEREPEVAELMSKLSFTNEQMNAILAWQEDNKASADDAAAFFLNNYKDVWKEWLNVEAREALAGLL